MYKKQTDSSKLGDWCRHYEEAIQCLLSSGKTDQVYPAVRLGLEAMALGLTPLDVASAHEKTLHNTSRPEEASTVERKRLKQADAFFKETIVPIEATHRAARKADIRIDRLTHTLQRRAAESAASDEQLEQAIAQREAVEVNADKRVAGHDKLLAEAERIQKDLRDRLRGIMSKQEGERKRIGDKLRNEIAQALLGIDICLLTLKTSKDVNTEKTEKSIADAREILRESHERGLISLNRQDHV